MKVISIVTSFPRNEKDILIPWIVNLICLLKEKGAETKVFTSSYCGKKDEVRENISVRRFRYFFRRWEKLSHDMSVPEKLKSNKLYFFVLPFFILFGTVSAFKYAKKNDLDLIHVHFPFPLAIFGIAMKIASKKPMVVSCHGSEVNMAKKNRVFRAVFKWMMKYADSITVNSLFMKKELIKIIGNREIEIIPMGSGEIDIEGKEGAVTKYDDKIRILFVGRLIKLKGSEYLIEALKMLDPEKYRLDIVGDGPERERLEEMSREEKKHNSTPQPPSLLGKEGGANHPSFEKRGVVEDRGELKKDLSRITFHGYLKGEKLEEMYKNADVFVLPSIVDDEGYTEGLGTVLLEAISYGIPVIGSNVGGIPDIILDGKTGILVPQKDPKALAEAIQLIAQDEKLRKELIFNAKKHLEENFSWEMISNKFLKIYQHLSDNRRK